MAYIPTEGIGISKAGKYKPVLESTYISDTTSLVNADKKLDNVLSEFISNSNNVKTFIEARNTYNNTIARNVYTILPFTTVEFDRCLEFDINTTTYKSKFDQIVLLCCRTGLLGVTSDKTTLTIALLLNDSIYTKTTSSGFKNTPDGKDRCTCDMTQIINVKKDDTLGVYVYQTDNKDKKLDGNSLLSIVGL